MWARENVATHRRRDIPEHQMRSLAVEGVPKLPCVGQRAAKKTWDKIKTIGQKNRLHFSLKRQANDTQQP